LVVIAWGVVLAYGLPWWTAALCTVLVSLVVLGRALLAKYRAGRADREIQRSLAAQAVAFEQRARPDRQAEVRALAAQFEQALETLRSAKFARGQSGALYTLPWYVIIGPPGAGKSTAIRQSGLQFPLHGREDSVRGIGGTRNCDWWLTNEAVLLDTAGRYATEHDDRDEWFVFLDMLRRARPKRPLNGLIVAVSIVDVATADERALANLSGCIRERIDEVMARLELRLPVYILLTKCDLVPGFCDSFEELRKAERQQVFGFTLPVAEGDDLAERVEHQWTRLVQVSERRSLLRLGDVRGLEARRAVYEFPQQLEALRDNVSSFMAQTFVENVYREAPVVRGVYLTSGTQEGSPIDRIMGAMASAFGLPPADQVEPVRTETKSYFLADLFRSVMFADRDLAAPSARSTQRLRTVRLLGALLVVLAAAGGTLYSASSYVANRESLQAARDDVVSAQRRPGGAHERVAPLRVLEPIRARLSLLHAWSATGAPLRLRAGLYRGESMLPVLRDFYTGTLRAVLVRPLVDQLQRDIVALLQRDRGAEHAPSPHDHAWLYDRLKAYLLLTQPKEPSEPALTPQLAAWLAEQLVVAWLAQDDSHPSPLERRAMTQHIATYLELLAVDPALGFSREPAVVDSARELLSRVPLVKLAVDRVVSAVDARDLDLTLEQLVSSVGLPLHAAAHIRGAFTRRGWEEHVVELLRRPPPELLGDAWVSSRASADAAAAADDDGTQARVCALRSEYFARYIEEWRTFIGTLRVEEPAQHARALIVLQDLTRGQPPPLERVVRAVAHNARLVDPARTNAGLEAKAEESGVLAQLTKRVQNGPAAQLLDEKDPCAGGAYLTEQSVRRELEGFFAFGASWDEPAAGTTAQVTSTQIYHEQLSYLRDALQAYQDDPGTADGLSSRLASARTRVRGLIEAQPVGWRPRFDALLWPPVNGSSVSSTSAMAGEKGQQWCTSVVVPFGRTLREHYPFARQGQDAALADVADFYRPESGILWGFYEATLKRDVVQVGARFERKPGASGGSMYTAELVRFLERSALLSNVLFAPRADKPGVTFEVRVRPSPGIAQVLLRIDGQQSDFHNGPERWHRFTWPGEGDQRQASMRIKGANIDETLVQEGEWGLFRLLDKGTVSVNAGERFFTVRFGLHTQHDVTLDVRPTRVDNPFVGTHGYLSAFRGDGVLAPRSITDGKKACLP
jgi:type VI secretion system protein ImpL